MKGLLPKTREELREDVKWVIFTILLVALIMVFI